MIGHIIETDACVAEGAAWLVVAEPRFVEALVFAGPLPLRRNPDGFAALLDAIVAQQVSVASASAIWSRLTVAGLTLEDNVMAASAEDLRLCGLSRQKIRYAKALAEARIDYASLRDLPDPEVVATLTRVPGVGRWTAEIYAMFSLGRADVFAPGDLALQEAARELFGLPTRPDVKAFDALSQAWRPWRAVAARALWAYYRCMKNREGTR